MHKPLFGTVSLFLISKTRLVTSVLMLVGAAANADMGVVEAQSNVYRPPNDNFFPQRNNTPQYVPAPQQQLGQPLPPGTVIGRPQVIRQRPTVSSANERFVPTPGQVYQPQFPGVPAQPTPARRPVTPTPAVNEGLKKSLIKARNLIQRYQERVKVVSDKNVELEQTILSLRKKKSPQVDNKQLLMAQQKSDQQQQFIQRLEREVAELKQTAMQAKESGASAMDQLAQLKQQNQTLQDELKNAEELVNQKDRQLAAGLKEQMKLSADQSQKITDVTKQAEQAVAALRQAETQNQQLTNELEEAQAAARKLMAAASDNDVSAELAEVKKSNQMLSENRQQLENEKQQLEADFQNLLLQQKQAENTRRTMVTENQQLQTLNQELQDMLEAARLTISEQLSAPKSATEESATEEPGVVANMSAQQEQRVEQPMVSGDHVSRDQYDALEEKLRSLTYENNQLIQRIELADRPLSDAVANVKNSSDSTVVETAHCSPTVAVSSVVPAVRAVTPIAPKTSGRLWPIKYWLLGFLGTGLFVGLAVAWYEQIGKRGKSIDA